MTSDSAWWDDQAASFDDEPDHGLGVPEARRAWADVLHSHMPPAPARVADMGCGTGTLSVLLAEAGHDVTGIDYAPRMVEAARRKASDAGVAARFLVGDVSTPPIAPARLDVVLSRHVLWAMPDPGAVLETWARLLAPGGRLLLVEGRWHNGVGLSAEDAVALVRHVREEARIEHLSDPVLWGGPLRDERYLVVSYR